MLPPLTQLRRGELQAKHMGLNQGAIGNTPWGTHWELREHTENLIRTHWELEGSMLGTKEK